MGFITLDDANSAALDQRMEVVYNNVNTHLQRPESLAVLNNEEIADPYVDVNFGGAVDDQLKERVIRELGDAGWHRVGLHATGGKGLYTIRMYKNASAPAPATPEPQTPAPAEPAPEEPTTPPAGTEPAASEPAPEDTTGVANDTPTDGTASDAPAAGATNPPA